MARKKTARAVEPNAGLRKAYTLAMKKLGAEFRSFLVAQILDHLEKRRALTTDALQPNKTREQRTHERLLRRKLLTEVAKAHPEMLRSDIDRFIGANIATWMQLLEGASVAMVTKYVAKIAFASSAAQRQAFIAAKVSKGMLDKVFGVPTVAKRFLSQRAKDRLSEMVRENVSLITQINADDVARISETILSGLQNGEDYNAIKETLASTQGFFDDRVERVCRDQMAKINTAVQNDNATELGIKEAIWVHIPGKYTSRESHLHMDGKRFSLSEGLFDPDVQRNVKPGELPNCRCIQRFVIPEDISNA